MKLWSRMFVLVVAIAALTGCDPASVPSDPSVAEMDVAFTAVGGADVDLMLGGSSPSRSQLLRVGAAVAPALLPASGPPSVAVQDNDGGAPYVRLRTPSAYTPGPHPVVQLDTKAALSVLAGMGYRSVDIWVSAPVVPATGTWQVPPDSVDTGWSWRAVTPGDPTPAGSIRLDPQPWRAIGELGLTTLAIVCLIDAALALRRRRRWRVVPTALAAGAAAYANVATAGAVQGDNLGVAGLLSGAPLRIATDLPLLGLLALFAALGVLAGAFALTGPPPTAVRSSPPPGPPATADPAR
jgi:hypothetical protein